MLAPSQTIFLNIVFILLNNHLIKEPSLLVSIVLYLVPINKVFIETFNLTYFLYVLLCKLIEILGENMPVSEKDIFYFVFASDRLNSEKFLYIKENRHIYKHEIEFFYSLQQNINQPIPQKVQDKINAYLSNMNEYK